MSQCWSTINRGTDLLAFHSNLLSSIFAPLTRDSQFLEDGTTPASVSVYSASRYATRSYCIINSNLLTSFQPWISERIYPYISTYISQRNSSFFTSSITGISNAVCRSSLLIVIDIFVYYVCSWQKCTSILKYISRYNWYTLFKLYIQ